MKIIHKLVIDLKDEVTIKLPPDSKIISVQEQFESIVLYFMFERINDFPEYVNRVIKIFGTGQSFDNNNLIYLGTVKTYGGNYMWHVFEEVL